MPMTPWGFRIVPCLAGGQQLLCNMPQDAGHAFCRCAITCASSVPLHFATQYKFLGHCHYYHSINLYYIRVKATLSLLYDITIDIRCLSLKNQNCLIF